MTNKEKIILRIGALASSVFIGVVSALMVKNHWLPGWFFGFTMIFLMAMVCFAFHSNELKKLGQFFCFKHDRTSHNTTHHICFRCRKVLKRKRKRWL